MKKTRSIRCPDVLNHICEELDTELSSARCREIRRHLANCPNCTAYLDSLKKTIKLYRSYPKAHVPKKARKELFAVIRFKS